MHPSFLQNFQIRKSNTHKVKNSTYPPTMSFRGAPRSRGTGANFGGGGGRGGGGFGARGGKINIQWSILGTGD
jgi:hypothetical protein